LKYSRKQPGESGFKKTLDDPQLSLDFPSETMLVAKIQNVTYTEKIVIWLHGADGNSLMKPDCRAMNPKACPEGHILKDEMGGCVFHMEIDYKSPGPYKRRDIGADYGGSGTLAGD